MQMASLGDYTVPTAPNGAAPMQYSMGAAYAPAMVNGSVNTPQQPPGYLTQMVISSPGTAAIVIGLLVTIILIMVIYYCGIGPIGPFVACTCTQLKKVAAADPAPATADVETESLIDSINKA